MIIINRFERSFGTFRKGERKNPMLSTTLGQFAFIYIYIYVYIILFYFIKNNDHGVDVNIVIVI